MRWVPAFTYPIIIRSHILLIMVIIPKQLRGTKDELQRANT